MAEERHETLRLALLAVYRIALTRAATPTERAICQALCDVLERMGDGS